MHNPILLIAMRYLHIVCAIIAVGGMAFMLLCVLPVAKGMEEAERSAFLAKIHHRFTRVVWACIAGLLVSGLFNWMANNKQYTEMHFKGQGLLGIKFLLALIIFGVVWARSAGYIKANNPRRLLMINIHLAAIVILLAAVIRYYRLENLAGHNILNLLPHN